MLKAHSMRQFHTVFQVLLVLARGMDERSLKVNQPIVKKKFQPIAKLSASSTQWPASRTKGDGIGM
jgi:hypothetical protein